VENEEVRGVTTELLDVLCYVTELENRLDALQQQIQDAQIITVEFKGDNF
jgi:uncharacterized small protein (DUF1192 family)